MQAIIKITDLRKKLIIFLASAILLSSFFASPLAFANQHTTSSTFKTDACTGLQQVDNKQSCTADTNALQPIVSSVVNIISYVVGIIAIIMIIVAGLKYVTSSGDSNRISSAKTTLIYALVGIVIVALAQFLVRVVFGTAVGGA